MARLAGEQGVERGLADGGLRAGQQCLHRAGPGGARQRRAAAIRKPRAGRDHAGGPGRQRGGHDGHQIVAGEQREQAEQRFVHAQIDERDHLEQHAAIRFRPVLDQLGDGVAELAAGFGHHRAEHVRHMVDEPLLVGLADRRSAVGELGREVRPHPLVGHGGALRCGLRRGGAEPRDRSGGKAPVGHLGGHGFAGRGAASAPAVGGAGGRNPGQRGGERAVGERAVGGQAVGRAHQSGSSCETRQWPRPLRLTSYIALSARCMRLSISSPPVWMARRDADRHRDLEPPVGGEMGERAGGLHAQILRALGGGELVGPVEPEGEFVAAEAGDEVGRADDAAQQLAGEAERVVPDLVAELVVQRLEVVEVDEHQRARQAIRGPAGRSGGSTPRGRRGG